MTEAPVWLVALAIFACVFGAMGAVWLAYEVIAAWLERMRHKRMAAEVRRR